MLIYIIGMERKGKEGEKGGDFHGIEVWCHHSGQKGVRQHF